MDNQDKKEWRWESGWWPFVEIVKWAFVFHRLGQEKPPGWAEIMSSSKMVSEKAEEYGMTMRAIANEMVRIGKDAVMMLDLVDETKRAEQQEKGNNKPDA